MFVLRRSTRSLDDNLEMLEGLYFSHDSVLEMKRTAASVMACKGDETGEPLLLLPPLEVNAKVSSCPPIVPGPGEVVVAGFVEYSSIKCPRKKLRKGAKKGTNSSWCSSELPLE